LANALFRNNAKPFLSARQQDDRQSAEAVKKKQPEIVQAFFFLDLHQGNILIKD